MDGSDKKIYFANLDALRFIAASMVIVFHLEHKKRLFGLQNAWKFLSFNKLGDFAVTIFFTLSGFLISYLLLKEKELSAKRTGIETLNIKNFYIRRILRIWPLYYLIVVTGFLVWPSIDLFFIPKMSELWQHLYTPTGFVTYFLFMPNVAYALFGNIPYIDQTWSIGVEEQFYIFWPMLFTVVRRKLIPWLLAFLFAYLLLKFYLFRISHQSEQIGKLYTLAYISRFSCMAIGGIAAAMLMKKHLFDKQLSFLGQKWIQFIVLLTVAAFTFTGMHKLFWIIDHEVFSVLVAVCLINLSQPEVSIINVQNKQVLYLGKISYGLYMYHNILIGFSIWLITKAFGIEHYNIALYLSSFALTILVSALSYEFFERPFLKLKEKFTVVKSGASPTH